MRRILFYYDKTLLKYWLIWKSGEWIGQEEFLWIWYKRAFKVRLEDHKEALTAAKL